MQSLVQKKANKRWIWVAYDPIHRLVLAYHIGDRGKKVAKEFWHKIPTVLKDCFFKIDDWEVYRSIIPGKNIKLLKTLLFLSKDLMLLLEPELVDWFENPCRSLNWMNSTILQLADSSGNLI
ncbi:MAG: IS1 family transposase [Bacteroidetes bacterium]|nr:IS1 family transposase [Bacteroidota bacterium]MDF1863509.1 IS1 family transposase [Saprospiraceae bacterium]